MISAINGNDSINRNQCLLNSYCISGTVINSFQVLTLCGPFNKLRLIFFFSSLFHRLGSNRKEVSRPGPESRHLVIFSNDYADFHDNRMT